jgi:hypothetical protein
MLAQDRSLASYNQNIIQSQKKRLNYQNQGLNGSEKSSATKQLDDKENPKLPTGSDLVRVILYTNGGVCNKFFNGIAPTNLYRESTSRMMIERYIRHICRFNVYLDAIVEKVEVPELKGQTLPEASINSR